VNGKKQYEIYEKILFAFLFTIHYSRFTTF